MLDKAQNDFNAGRFADARSGVETLNKWGLQPAEADQARLDALQLKIVEIAKISGGAITDGGITTSPAPTPGPTPASNANTPVKITTPVPSCDRSHALIVGIYANSGIEHNGGPAVHTTAKIPTGPSLRTNSPAESFGGVGSVLMA